MGIKRKGNIPLETRSEIIEDWKNGLSNLKNAQKHKVSKDSVTNLIKKYKRTGDVKDLERSGRKRSATTPENWRKMAEILERTPNISQRQLAKQLNLNLGPVHQMHVAFQRNRSMGQNWSSKLVNPVIIGNLEEPTSESACPDPDWSPSPAPSASVPATTTTYDDWNDETDDNHSVAEDNQDEVVQVHRCFLCDSIGAQMLDVHFTPESIPEIPAQVQKGLGVFCFLGKVLKMRNEDLVTLMKEAEGRNPSEWGISVCSDPTCAEVVERAIDLWKEIKKLEEELRTRAKEIIGRIRRSLKGGSEKLNGQAVLNKRVREVLMTSQSQKEGEVMEYLSQPVVKVEPQVEDLNSFDDDFHVSEDLSNDRSDTPLGVDESDLKVEVTDEQVASRRKSSRMKRKSERFKFDDLSSSKKRRHGKAGRAEGRKVEKKKKTKSGSKASRFKLAKREEPAAAPVMKANISTKKSDDEDKTMFSCQLCPTLERMGMDEFIAHICFHSRCRNKCSGCNSYFPDSSACSEHSEKCGVGSTGRGPAKVIVESPAEAVDKIWDCSSRSKCKAKFASGEDRVRHEMEVHGIPVPQGVNDFSCSLCPSATSKLYSLTELRLHKAIEHPEEAVLSCSYCDTQFAIQSEKEGIKFLNLDQLKKHICEEHPEKMKTNSLGPTFSRFLQTCPICGLVFSSSYFTKLDNHIAQEHRKNLYEVYSCPICPGKKMRNADAWEHVKKWHWPDAPKPFICQFCGKGFRHNKNWKVHEQIHKNRETRPFQCELCGSSFAVKTYLCIHMRVTHQHRPSPSALRKRKSNDKVLPQPTEASTFN